MQLAFGQPSLFFTVSPDNSLVFRIADLAGDVPSEMLHAIDDTMNISKTFLRAHLGMISTQNPVACARYFDRIIAIIIEVLFDWNQTKKCSKGKGGIFGTTEAFYGSTESQSPTGSLHSDMMVWIRGMPRTLEQYTQLRNTDHFRQRLVSYVDSILHASYPVSTNNCPSCHDTNLEAVAVTQQAFKSPPRNDMPKYRTLLFL
ncbi:hypothetical protein PHMEG_00015483 [Phytophthora megakarya]|uniref:Helitron helicase-like domain-containing protein n=1 Tax=Phytophthora megakarya TaxID=4795 RepID=A0A225W2R4_9STRA|nr:hypothetical protein PHMEG_00015483 [Phytophthora megakarya]